MNNTGLCWSDSFHIVVIVEIRRELATLRFLSADNLFIYFYDCHFSFGSERGQIDGKFKWKMLSKNIYFCQPIYPSEYVLNKCYTE